MRIYIIYYDLEENIINFGEGLRWEPEYTADLSDFIKVVSTDFNDVSKYINKYLDNGKKSYVEKLSLCILDNPILDEGFTKAVKIYFTAYDINSVLNSTRDLENIADTHIENELRIIYNKLKTKGA